MSLSSPHPLLADLAAVLPAASLITDPDKLAPRLMDARKRLQGQALGMALPACTDDVVQIVYRCRQHGVAIVPQAGNTSLVGGATPVQENTLILGCDKLNRVLGVDPMGYTLTAQAGCILDDVRSAAEAAGRLFPLWLGSSGSARIGGLIGTNAGGLQVQRYGNMRELTLGIEAVLPDGSVFRGLHTLRKRNAGYDLKQLFIGAEGTLGFVTAATLRLFPAEHGHATAVIAVQTAAEALQLFSQAKTALGEVLTAFELMNHASLCLMKSHFPAIGQPFHDTPPYAVLIGISGGEPDAVLQERLLAVLLQSGQEDAAIAQDMNQSKALWALRGHIPAAQTRQGPSIKHDLALPISAIPAFIAEAEAQLALQFPAARPVVFGHVGDGNLHFNLSLPDSTGFASLEQAANTLLFDLVGKYGGDISAEHGIGRLRIAAADKGHDPIERALMRQIKAALDPEGLFNPGVLV
ncbi:FAD-binding oxidoreductase [Chitinimonas naiadis]